MEIGKEDSFEKTHVGGDIRINGSEPDFNGLKPIVSGSVPVEVKVITEEPKAEEPKTEDFDELKPSVCGSEPVGGEPGCTVKVEEELKPEGNVSLPIEKVIKKVSLGDEIESGNSSSESESESESESSASSSSSSSSDDDDDDDDSEEEEEDEEKMAVEVKGVDGADDLEEGEIMGMNEEVAVDGSDDDDDDDEEDVTGEILSALDIDLDEIDEDEDGAGAGAGAVKGPIKSKNEVEVLPEVPPLEVELQPHHQMLPVGVVLSTLGTKVIVEGREQHNPLNEGSVLWITTDRSPLGYVDEIFGPVKNPYYVVRYNSESEVPAGIHEGATISFVREFADHVLNDKNIHKKGYDASGENDEELTEDGEFSDDEKEAEYKRMQKMTKRGMNDQRVGNQKSNKKKNNRNGAWKNDRNSAQQTATAAGQHPPNNQNQHNFSTVSASLVNHNCSSAVVGEENFVGGSGFTPPFSGMPQSSGIIGPSNGVWPNGMPGQHPQNAIFPNGMLSQNYQQQPFPLQNPAMSMPNMMPYQQQFNPSLGTLPNMMLPCGQSSLFAGPGSAPWLGMAGQNGFNQSALGMAMQSPQFQNALQGLLTNGPTVDGNCNLQPNGVQSNFESSQNFNMGPSSGRGRKPFHRGRGRGRFSGGRGHQRS